MNSYVIMTKDFSDIWINYLSNIQKINIDSVSYILLNHKYKYRVVLKNTNYIDIPKIDILTYERKIKLERIKSLIK